jgi:hypothetical protein
VYSKIASITALVCLALPCMAQKGTILVDFGQASSRFGSLNAQTGSTLIVGANLRVASAVENGSGLVTSANGEFRYSGYGDAANGNFMEIAGSFGPSFFFANHFSFGGGIGMREMLLPNDTYMVGGQVQTFDRTSFLSMELPFNGKVTFGPAGRGYVSGQYTLVWPIVNNTYTDNLGNTYQTGTTFPNSDHAYNMKGSVGYVLPHGILLRGNYEDRYYKFQADGTNNPYNLYNLRQKMITAGVGKTF